MANNELFLFFFISYVRIDETCFPSGSKHRKTKKHTGPKQIKRVEMEEHQNKDIDHLVVFSHKCGQYLIKLGIIVLELLLDTLHVIINLPP